MNPHPNLSMKSATQLAVFLANRPGALARVCDALAKVEINIHALATSDTVDHSVVRMVVSDPTKALMLLGEAGVLALETDGGAGEDRGATFTRRGEHRVCLSRGQPQSRDRPHHLAAERCRESATRVARLVIV